MTGFKIIAPGWFTIFLSQCLDLVVKRPRFGFSLHTVEAYNESRIRYLGRCLEPFD